MIHKQLPAISNEKYFVELSKHFRTFSFLRKESISLFSSLDTGKASRALFVLQAGLHRNIRLMDGLELMLKSRNMLCAASIVRMQIDTCMRLNAPLIVSVDEREKCFLSILKRDESLRKMKIMYGGERKRLLDGFLKERLNERVDGTSQIYDKLSGFIHLGESAFWDSAKDENSIETNFVIGGETSEVFNPVLLKVVEWFEKYTVEQFKIMEEYKKLLPQSEQELAKALS